MDSPAPLRAGPRLQRLLEADRHFSARLRYAEKPGRLRRLAIFLAHSGDSWFWGLGLAAVWLLGGPEAKTWAVRLALRPWVERYSSVIRESSFCSSTRAACSSLANGRPARTRATSSRVACEKQSCRSSWLRRWR